ncbi:hypothetical protein P3387_24250, partial [Vibrio parahaemolyticus]|nr:hypothetical protein [Vibrio parahaemolyticus]
KQTETQPTLVCGAHVGSKWAENWALYGIVNGFHNGPMPIAHMGGFTRPAEVQTKHQNGEDR